MPRIISEDGSYGLGESSPIWSITGETQETAYQAGQDLARLILHKDPLETVECMRVLEAFLIDNSSITCAFDMALADWVGKRLGVPVWMPYWVGNHDPWLLTSPWGLLPAEMAVEGAQESRARF